VSDVMAPQETSTAPEGEVRARLRGFLRQLFDTLGDPLDDGWPDVPPEVYHGHMARLRGQIDGLYSYIDRLKSLNKGQKLLARFLPESALQLLRHDWMAPAGALAVDPVDEARLSSRPPPEVDFDQLYCTIDSTARRARRISAAYGAPSDRVLFMGDDDLGSVLLAPQFPGEIHALDLDERLLSYIEEAAPEVHRHRYDLMQRGVPARWFESFDAVVLDPPWDYHGAWAFLTKAIYCLKQTRTARLFLSFCPLQLEIQGRYMPRFWRRLTRLGLTCETITPCFNLYDLKTIDTPAYDALFEYHLPQIESPLMDLLRQTPFTYAHMYELRRIEAFQMNRLTRAMFRWWHAA